MRGCFLMGPGEQACWLLAGAVTWAEWGGPGWGSGWASIWNHLAPGASAKPWGLCRLWIPASLGWGHMDRGPEKADVMAIQ